MLTRRLVAREQENIDRAICDNQGNTAVHLACQRDDEKLLKLLLTAGKGVGERELIVRNGLGWAAVHTCSFYGRESGVRLLLQWRSPPDLRTADGWTALHLACSEGQLGCVRTLLASGAQLDSQHPSGESALGIAAARGRHLIISELLRAGASPSAPSDEYATAPRTLPKGPSAHALYDDVA